jgi:hypothetical protein
MTINDKFTDLNTGQVYPVFTKDRSAKELCFRLFVFMFVRIVHLII